MRLSSRRSAEGRRVWARKGRERYARCATGSGRLAAVVSRPLVPMSMSGRISWFVLAFLAAPASAQSACPGLLEAEAQECVLRTYRPTVVLDSAPSKDRLYASVDSSTVGGVLGVEGVYSGYRVPFDCQPSCDPSQDVYNGGSGISQEHIFPRSRGTDGNAAETDLHHLVPAKQTVNAARSNDPFATLPDMAPSTWYREGVTATVRPADPEAWSQSSGGAFEPRAGVRGDVARAMFYVAAVYAPEVDVAWFEAQVGTLLAWHDAEPATEADVERSERVALFQSGCLAEVCVNPFVVDASLARRVFAAGTVATEEGPSAMTARVWPNPSRGGGWVEAASVGAMHIEVVDVLGRLVWSRKSVGRVELPVLAAGVYGVRVEAMGQVSMVRWTVAQ